MKKALVFAAVLGALFAYGHAEGATRTVNTVSQLQVALRSLQGNGQNDTVIIEPGIYEVEETITVLSAEDYSLVIEGAGTGITVLRGNGDVRLLHIVHETGTPGALSGITIRGLSLRGGFSESDGGGLLVSTDTSSVTLEDVELAMNASAGAGGGARVMTETGEILVERTSFDGNSSSASGGGLSVTTGGGSTKIRASSFTGNIAQGGGGMWLETHGGPFSMVNSVLGGNRAGEGGGAGVSASAAPVALVNVTVTGNTASSGSGLLFEVGGGAVVTIANAILQGNGEGPGHDLEVRSSTDRAGSGSLLLSHSNVGTWGSDATVQLMELETIPDDPALGPFYRLDEQSPLRGAGEAGLPGLPATDYEGDDRFADTEVDIGADEFTDGALPVTILEPALLPVAAGVPTLAKPLGLGNVALGGELVDIAIGLASLGSAADVYLGLQAAALGDELLLVAPGPVLQSASVGLVPWKAASSGGFEERPFGEISLSVLPAGRYTVYLGVARAGTLSFEGVWSTQFRVPGYVGVTPEEAQELIAAQPGLVIIDVSPFFDLGHLPGAVNYPLGDGTLAAALPMLDPAGVYLVYCHGDAIAIAAAESMLDAGFETVYYLRGSFAAWVDAGYPMEP